MPERRILRLELGLVDFLENVLEAAVIGFQDRVLGREIDRIFAQDAVVQRGAREIADRIVEIVHRHGDAAAGELEHFALDHVAVVALETQGQAALAGNLEIGRAILVAVGVAADHDRLRPAGHQARHVLADDRLAEDDAAEDVADRAVRALPHFLQLEFDDPRLVGRDRRAFHADAAGLDRLGRLDRHPIVGGVAVFDAEVEILQIDVEIGMDQLVADEMPDDARHLVAVEFDDRILDLDLWHLEGSQRSALRGGSSAPIASGSRAAKRCFSLNFGRGAHARPDRPATGSAR